MNSNLKFHNSTTNNNINNLNNSDVDSTTGWILSQEARKTQWQDLRTIATAGTHVDVEHLFDNEIHPAMLITDSIRPHTSDGIIRDKNNNINTGNINITNKKNKINHIHTQFGKSPYLIPMINKNKNNNYNKTKNNYSTINNLKKNDILQNNTTLNINYTNKNNYQHYIDTIIHNEKNIHSHHIANHSMPLQKLVNHHASQKSTNSFINTATFHNGFNNNNINNNNSDNITNNTNNNNNNNNNVDNVLYDILKCNRYEMLRFALHFAEEKGLLSNTNLAHKEWIKYFEYHLGISHETVGDINEYDKMYESYVNNSKKLVSDRVSGCGIIFKPTIYYPAQKTIEYKKKHDTIILLNESELNNSEINNNNNNNNNSTNVNIENTFNKTIHAPASPFPIEEFIIISPQELLILLDFNTPPIELWTTLKVVMFIFSTYHSHTLILENEKNKIKLKKDNDTIKNMILKRSFSEKYIDGMTSKLSNSPSIDHDLSSVDGDDDENRKSKREVRSELKKIHALLLAPKRTDSFMMNFDLDEEVKLIKQNKLHGTNNNGSHNIRNISINNSSLEIKKILSNVGCNIELPSKTIIPTHGVLNVYTDHKKLYSHGLHETDNNNNNNNNNKILLTASGKELKLDTIPTDSIDVIRNLLDLPIRQSTIEKNHIQEYWRNFTELKKNSLDPITPSLDLTNRYNQIKNILIANSGEMKSDEFIKLLNEYIKQETIYNESMNTNKKIFENKLNNKYQIENNIITDCKLENNVMSFSWEDFKQFLRKYPNEFCSALTHILQDEEYYTKFPEGLLSDLKLLINSQLFQPIKLMTMKSKIGAKLCLWSRRVIALLYDAHIRNVKTITFDHKNDNISIIEEADIHKLTNDFIININSQKTFETTKVSTKLSESVQTSLFHFHGLSSTSSKDQISKLINYPIPNILSNDKMNDENINIIQRLRDPINFYIEVMASEYNADSSDYGSKALNVLPTKSSMLSYYLALDLIKPMDSLQVIAVKNTGLTKYQREFRQYALLKYVSDNNQMNKLINNNNNNNNNNKIKTIQLNNLKTREDIELFEKSEIQLFFNTIISKLNMENEDIGGLNILSPIYNAIALTPQRLKRQILKFPFLTNQELINNNNNDNNDSISITEESERSEDIISFSYEPHEILHYVSNKQSLNSNNSFVVIGYDFDETNIKQKVPNSDYTNYLTNLIQISDGWIHRHGILRDAKTSLIIAKSLINRNIPAKYIVAVNESLSSKAALLAATKLLKPGDTICVFHVLDIYRKLSAAELKHYEEIMDQLDEKNINMTKTPIVKLNDNKISLTKKVLEKQEKDKLIEFTRIHALRRAQNVILKYKQLGYNVLLVDNDNNYNNNLNNTIHPIVALSNRISKYAMTLQPTYLVMGIGNYGKVTIDKYYSSLNKNTKNIDNTAFTTISELIIDNPLVKCSVVATMKSLDIKIKNN